MGATDSKLAFDPEAQARNLPDHITTVSTGVADGAGPDPALETLKSLRAIVPLLRVYADTNNLKDLLLKATSPSNIDQCSLSASTTIELVEKFEEWQQAMVAKVGACQNEIHNKIDVAEALALKLLQRLNYAASVMKANSEHLREVDDLRKHMTDLKIELQVVLDNYNDLLRRYEVQESAHLT